MPYLILFAVLSFAALAPTPASAQIEAQEILWYCSEPPDTADHERIMRYFKCLGYLEGAHDMMAFLFSYGGRENTIYCIPKKGLSLDQLRRVVIKWIKENPSMMDATARQVIQFALMETFPCRKASGAAPQQSRVPPPQTTAR